MSNVHVWKRLLIGTALAAGVPAALAWATPSMGSQSVLIGRAILVFLGLAGAGTK